MSHPTPRVVCLLGAPGAGSPGWERITDLLAAEATAIHRPVHRGTASGYHHLVVAYLLNTEGLSEADRVAARVAALVHDAGKRRGQGTAGAHGSVGAALVRHGGIPVADLADPDRVADLAAAHDLPGRVVKGCLDTSEPGSLPASALDEMDEAAWRLWIADIRAIPAYAWVAELAPLLRGWRSHAS